jgi:hypothetical protein
VLHSRSDGDDWLRPRELLGQLSVRLRMVGVPQEIVRGLDASALHIWRAMMDTGEAGRPITALNSAL